MYQLTKCNISLQLKRYRTTMQGYSYIDSEGRCLVVHKSPGFPEYWRVSEPTTGAGVSIGSWTSRKEAIAETEASLKRHGNTLDKFKSAITAWQRQHA